MRFLIDANLSPETAVHLRSLGHDVKSLIEEGLGYISDKEVARHAMRERRILVAFDLDFGEFYHFSNKKRIGVIVLRLQDQRIEMINTILEVFLKHLKRSISNRLVILTETNVRIT